MSLLRHFVFPDVIAALDAVAFEFVGSDDIIEIFGSSTDGKKCSVGPAVETDGIKGCSAYVGNDLGKMNHPAETAD